jgi:hypothetical protein
VIFDDRSSPIPMDFIPMIQTEANSLVSTSVAAVGMAALANVNGSLSIASAARRKYIQCLSLTRAALDNLSFVHTDAVFRSVLLLAMFEVGLLHIC